MLQNSLPVRISPGKTIIIHTSLKNRIPHTRKSRIPIPATLISLPSAVYSLLWVGFTCLPLFLHYASSTHMKAKKGSISEEILCSNTAIFSTPSTSLSIPCYHTGSLQKQTFSRLPPSSTALGPVLSCGLQIPLVFHALVLRDMSAFFFRQ